MISTIYTNISNEPGNGKDGNLLSIAIGFYTTKELAQEAVDFYNQHQLYPTHYNTLGEDYLVGAPLTKEST
jgi:hypothetical protein